MANEHVVFDFKGAAEQEVKKAADEYFEKLNKRNIKEFNNDITIVFNNGHMITYTGDEYTEYKYDGKIFVVIRDTQWIGLFNIDAVEYITVGK